MKTPKRYQEKPLPLMPEDSEVDWMQIDVWCARAKRKNRVKQLKRSLEKYKYGIHLRGDVGAAYRRLQCIVHPCKKATLTEWLTFMRELQIVQKRLQDAIVNATYYVKVMVDGEAKDRKEQK